METGKQKKGQRQGKSTRVNKTQRGLFAQQMKRNRRNVQAI